MKARIDNDAFENMVATFVDVSSIVVAYEIGVSGFGLEAGVAYALLDAFLVVWMRKRIASAVRRIVPRRGIARGQSDEPTPRPL